MSLDFELEIEDQIWFSNWIRDQQFDSEPLIALAYWRVGKVILRIANTNQDAEKDFLALVSLSHSLSLTLSNPFLFV